MEESVTHKKRAEEMTQRSKNGKDKDQEGQERENRKKQRKIL